YDKPCQFFITEAEFNEFIEFDKLDEFFYHVSRENRIELISKSLDDKELKVYKENLQSKIKYHRVFIHKNVFPFDIMDNNGIGPFQLGEPLIKQNFASVDSAIFLNIPELTFNQKKHALQNTWFLDLDIFNSDNLMPSLKFCKTENPQVFLRLRSRVNKKHNL